METTHSTLITVMADINAPLARVWEFYTHPIHIIHWNQASDDWHTSYAELDFREGGAFLYRMEARDGSMGFDMDGNFIRIQYGKEISYQMTDGRKVQLLFTESGNQCRVTEHFEPESLHSLDLQKEGWQSILDSFKRYVEKTDPRSLMHFEILIHAPAELVHKNMIDPEGYRKWTSVFNKESHYKGSWDKGSEIHFIGVDEGGNSGGMISRIKENIPGKFISIEHLGMLKGEEKILSGQEVEPWKGALENYSFKGKERITLLCVDIDSNDEFRNYFECTWPSALDLLKNLCESKG